MRSFRVIVALHRCRPVFSIPLPLLNPILRMLFQVPYPVSPVFGTLTKTAGVCTNNSHSGYSPLRTSRFLSHSCELLCNLLRTLLYSPRTQLVCFQPIPYSLRKNIGGGYPCFWFNVAESSRIQGRMRLWP